MTLQSRPQCGAGRAPRVVQVLCSYDLALLRGERLMRKFTQTLGKASKVERMFIFVQGILSIR